MIAAFGKMGLAVSLPKLHVERWRFKQKELGKPCDFTSKTSGSELTSEPQMTAIVSIASLLIFGCPVFFGDLFLDGTCGEKETFASQLLKFSARFQRCNSQTFTEM